MLQPRLTYVDRYLEVHRVRGYLIPLTFVLSSSAALVHDYLHEARDRNQSPKAGKGSLGWDNCR